MNIPIDQGWIEAVMLAGVRMAAFIVIAPPFSYNAFPGMVKAMIAIGLAIAASPIVTHGYKIMDTAGFLETLFTQLIIGFALGFIVFLIFAAVQAAGALVDLSGGFQMAQAFDPTMSLNGAQFTRLFQMTAIALMFSSDAYQLIIGGLAKTFTTLPLEAHFSLATPVNVMVDGASQMFLDAIQFAGPLMIVLFLADAGLGLLTRVAPALNAFSMGYPLKVFITLTLGSITFVALPNVIASLTTNAVDILVAK